MRGTKLSFKGYKTPYLKKLGKNIGTFVQKTGLISKGNIRVSTLQNVIFAELTRREKAQSEKGD